MITEHTCPKCGHQSVSPFLVPGSWRCWDCYWMGYSESDEWPQQWETANANS